MVKKNGKEPKVWRIVLDVLKPHSPNLPEFAIRLSSMEGVDEVNIILLEIDKETETLKITIDGELSYPEIKSTIEEWGGVIHSIDEVIAGRNPIK